MYEIDSANQDMHIEIMAKYVVGCLLAAILERKTYKHDKMDIELRKTVDSGEEKALLLSEKNKALAEKQNSEIYAATLRERNRIAREIHDNVGHVLSRTILLTGAARALFFSDKRSAFSSPESTVFRNSMSILSYL